MSNKVENYGWNVGDAPQSCGYIAPAVRKIIKSIDGNSVIDIGCGNGALVAQLAKDGYRVSGVEYDENGFALAKKLYKHIPFYNMGVEDDPTVIVNAEGSRFDVVVSTEVVEHLFSPHLLPKFAHGLLKDRGFFILSTPYHGYLKNLALSIFNKWDHHHTALWHGGHIKFWSVSTLTELLEKNGFRVVEFHGVGRAPFLWKSMVLVAQKV